VRTEDLDPVQARSVQRATERILDFIIIGVLLLVIAMLIVGRRPFYRQTGESISRKASRVLPFENRSRRHRQRATLPMDPGRDSDALIQDRRSEGDLPHIDAALYKCAWKPCRNREATWRRHIVEGSVQKSGDTVRVNVQLIKAAMIPIFGLRLLIAI
jgi:hypothetical protein